MALVMNRGSSQPNLVALGRENKVRKKGKGSTYSTIHLEKSDNYIPRNKTTFFTTKINLFPKK